MNTTDYIDLINNLTTLPKETEWIEFKLNYICIEEIGEYISALSNSTCLLGKNYGYLIYGIENGSNKIKGTNFKGKQIKKGNEELENWITHNLKPRIDFEIIDIIVDKYPLVIFKVDATKLGPVSFRGTEYIRVGSYKKKLIDHPEKERKIWDICRGYSFEKDFAQKNLSSDEILKKLDYPSYFELMKQNLPDNKEGILRKLCEEKLISLARAQVYNVTNLGAVLFAKKLSDFDRLSRKTVRVIQYKGKNKITTIKEQIGGKGYAAGFETLIDYINNLLPSNEEVGKTLRKEVKMYPEIAVRELVANSLIHQDFSETGSGPLVEIYDDRIEISNPGKPLIETLRFIDHNPQSRNEQLASFMRRVNICEERGSGIKKVINSCEVYQLPAPNFIAETNYMKVTLYAPMILTRMNRIDKIRACYQHCCLKYVSNDIMTNQSLRERFGIEEKNYATASRIISDTIKHKLVKYQEPLNKSRKYAKYIPFWA